MNPCKRKSLLVAAMSLVFLLALAATLHAQWTMHAFIEVDEDDPDQSLPRFTYTTTSPPGTGVKLRIVPCETQAFASFVHPDPTKYYLNQYDSIQCYVDVIDADGNIVNKDYTASPVTVTVTLTEIGGASASSAKFNTVFTSPQDYDIDDGRGAEFGLSDSEPEQVEINATAAGFTDADPVTIAFTPPGTITGTVTLPAGTDTSMIWITAYAQDVGNRDISVYIPILTPSQLSNAYTLSLLAPGTYRIGFQGFWTYGVADPVKFVPVCENTTPLQATVAAGETQDVGGYTLQVCTRGGLEGDVSIAGRANLNGTLTTVIAVDDSGALCNSSLDLMASLNNYTATDGNHYTMTCLAPGTYRIIGMSTDMTAALNKTFWEDAGTVVVPASGMATKDIVLTDEFDIGMYFTILYNSPVEYDAVASLAPMLQWTNDLSQDPNVPAGLTLDGIIYDISVVDRCGNSMWHQEQIPQVGSAGAQSITYGDTSKGITQSAPQPFNQQQVFNWNVSGMKYASGYDFSTGSAGWTLHTVSPPFTAPNSSAGGGNLSITATDNTLNFGYWQSPLTAIDLSPDMLYRVGMLLSTDVADQSQVPQIRMRVNSSTLQQADYQIIDSQGGGQYSPTGTPQYYYLYFAPQKSAASSVADFASIAFDLLNFNPGDAANGTVSLHAVEIKVCAEASLTGQTSAASWDFSGGAGSWQFASSIPFTSPTSGQSGGALLLTATDNTANFGYWFSPFSELAAQDSRLYRALFTVRSSLIDKSIVPELRMRFLTENYQCGRVMEILSSGSGDLSPDTTNRTFSVYFYPPQSMSGGNGMSIAFDLLNFDPSDSNNATIYLDGVAVDSFDIPTMY